MKSITLGLALSLLGGVALAQQAPPQPSPTPPAKQPVTGSAAQPAPPAASDAEAQSPSMPQATAQAGQPHPGAQGQNGAPEGEIIETPNGFYIVRPGQGRAQNLDTGRMGMGQQGAAQNGPTGAMEGDEPMDDMADETLQPPPPHPHKPPPPRQPQGKGGAFRIRTPNLNVGVKCPEDEPIKACVDAISQLMDKVGPQAH